MMEEKLINLVRDKQHLYFKSDKLYKNSFLRERTWEQIGEKLNIRGELAKKRWRTLRDRYKRERQRLVQPPGSVTKRKSPWKYMKMLQFLDDVTEERETISNYNDEDIADVDQKISRSSSKDEVIDLMQTVNKPSTGKSPGPSTSICPPNNAEISISKSARNNDDIVERAQADFSELLEATKSLIASRTKPTYISLFFKTITEQLESASLPNSLVRDITGAITKLVNDKISDFEQKPNIKIEVE